MFWKQGEGTSFQAVRLIDSIQGVADSIIAVSPMLLWQQFPWKPCLLATKSLKKNPNISGPFRSIRSRDAMLHERYTNFSRTPDLLQNNCRKARSAACAACAAGGAQDSGGPKGPFHIVNFGPVFPIRRKGQSAHG